jgi:RHS repeat-associated protein
LTEGHTIIRSNGENLFNDDPQADKATDASRYHYTGHGVDATDLQYQMARHFDPTIDRWINQDPVRFEDGANLYRYVGNQPCNLTDHTAVE